MMDYFSVEQVKHILLLKDLQGHTIDAIFQDDTPEQRYSNLIKVFLGLENVFICQKKDYLTKGDLYSDNSMVESIAKKIKECL
ncbi:hypothetical protein [Enterococcus faecium]|uniref:hypothetical protein n=1 Tax=Enterococcus faecium TaxID=1352 RepID=UPI00093BB629|nr:hypothetical protein [Enterococcus faecium]PHL10699.1 hypothetical protein CQR41_04920 [Enterococcus faecium]